MRVLVVSKAISNGGDYLYRDKILEILIHEYPENEYVYYNGIDYVDENYIADFDRVIISGGPNYDNRLMNYENFAFLRQAILQKKRIFLIGMGCYGRNNCDEDIYETKFNEETLSILNAIESNGGILGTRDFIASRILKNNGFRSIIVTGCPVWYDYEYLNKDDNEKVFTEPLKIVISDPGMTKCIDEQENRAEQAIEVIDYVIKKFPNSDIQFTFNNGINTKYSTRCNTMVENHLKLRGIKYYNLSYSASGFAIYNNADLHVGFRVHSHLYCLSRKIPSVLIEEDRRGYAMSETLGMPHLLGYDEKQGDSFRRNRLLIKKLDDVITESLQNNFLYNKLAYEVIKYYYVFGMKEILKRCFED